MKDLRTLAGVAAPHRLALAFGATLMLGESLAALALPALGGLAVGAILAPASAPLGLSAILGAMLAAFAILAVLRFGAASLLDAAADRIIADLKARLYDHLQALPMDYFEERRLGDSLALLTNDVAVVGGFVAGALVSLVPLALTGAGAAAMMMGIRADLALLAVVIVPLTLLALRLAGRRVRPLLGG